MQTIDRRAFLRGTVVLGGGLVASGPLQALAAREAVGAPTTCSGYGPLIAQGDLALPPGFEYEVISRQGDPMSDGNLTPGIFDGMGAFPGPRNRTILIRNHENRRRAGEFPVIVPPELRYDSDPTYNAGNTTLFLRRSGSSGRYVVERDFAVLGGTDTNCAGGELPDGWITCEEVVNRSAAGTKHGYSFFIPKNARGPVKARPILNAGRFVHEAAAWHDGVLYQTEDRSISTDPELGLLGACLYRYIPRASEGQGLASSGGRLEALKLRSEFHANMDVARVVGRRYRVEWVTVDEPDHDDDTDERRDRIPGFTPTRVHAQDKGAAFFDRQEGAWVGDGKIYFDCTTGGEQNLGQVWAYDPKRETIMLIYESTSPESLENPDNVVIVPETGHILLQEDGSGAQFVRALTPNGCIYDFAMTTTNQTEFCGGCFNSDGDVFFINQQGERGGPAEGPPGGAAVTYAIYGPWGEIDD
jgi:uncharacterized protein